MTSVFITNEVKHRIVKKVESRVPANDQTRFSICEWLAALEIIKGCLGEDYFRREFKMDADFEATKQSTASKYVNHATAESNIKIKRLAQCVEDLHCCSGFEHKRKELRGSRFDSVSFELLSASYFQEIGLHVEFLGGSSRKKCEYLLDDSVHVECKNMTDGWAELKNLESRFTNYLDDTVAKIPNGSKGILLVAFPADHNPSEAEKEAIGRALKNSIRRAFDSSPTRLSRLLAVRILAEVAESTSPGYHWIGFRRIGWWRFPEYRTLPAAVKRAIEDDQPRLMPRVWIDYKGLSRREKLV